MNKKIEAAGRYSRLRAAGVPALLSPRAAWFLSGGVVHVPFGGQINLSTLVVRVPDCEHFLPDYQEMAQS